MSNMWTHALTKPTLKTITDARHENCKSHQSYLLVAAQPCLVHGAATYAMPQLIQSRMCYTTQASKRRGATTLQHNPLRAVSCASAPA
eukprot:4900664-Alexandrium_andersonii.AAC.1